MKTKLKFLKFLLGILTIGMVISLSNCGPEKTECDNWPDGIVKTYYHFNADTLKIPYHGLDTLKFLRITPSDTDTVTFYGQGKKHYTITETDYDFYYCRHDDIYDAYSISFKESTNFEIIQVNLFVVQNGYIEFTITYKGRTFNDVMWIINNAAYGGFINNVVFNNQTFYKVVYLDRKYNDIDEKLYLSHLDGIIRFEFNTEINQLIKK